MTDLDNLYMSAIRAKEAGDFKNSLTMFRRFVELEPNTADGWKGLAKLCYLNQLQNESIDAWLTSLLYSIFDYCCQEKAKSAFAGSSTDVPDDIASMFGLPPSRPTFTIDMLNDIDYRRELVSKFFSLDIHLGHAILDFDEDLVSQLIEVIKEYNSHLTIQQAEQAFLNNRNSYRASLVNKDFSKLPSKVDVNSEKITHSFDYNRLYMDYGTNVAVEHLDWEALIKAIP